MPLTKKIYVRFIVLLSWVFPWAGAFLALKLFLTPTRVPRPSSEKEFFESARRFTFANGIAAFEWGPTAGPTVLLVHGWSGRGTQMGAFAAPLVAEGYRVVAIDGPAHGASAGKTTNVGAFANSLVDVQKSLGPLEGLIAHSFGAGCSIVAVSRGLRVPRVVLIAGPAKYERVLENFFKLLPISPRAQKILLRELGKKAGIQVQDLQVGRLGAGLQVKALVVHDEDDKEVLFRSALEIEEAWPQAKIFRTQGLGHRRVLRDPQVLRAVTEFIKS